MGARRARSRSANTVLHAAGHRRGRVSKLRPADRHEPDAIRQGVAVSRRQCARRPPRDDAVRSHRIVAPARRAGSGARLRRADSAFGRQPRGVLSRLASRTHAVHRARGNGLAAAATHRSRHDAAPEAEREGRAGAGEPRAVLQRRAAAVEPVARQVDETAHGHPAGRTALCRDRFVPPGRGRGCLHRAAARSPPRTGGQELCDVARRDSKVADLHPALGFRVAGRLSIRAAAVPAGGHDHHDGVHLRQLRGEPAQPAASAAPRDLRPADDRGDGRALAPGRAAQRRRPARGWRAPSTRRSCAKRSSGSRRGSRPIPTTRRSTTTWRCSTPRPAISIARRRTLPKRSGSSRIPPPRTTTSATCCSVKGGAPKRSTISGMPSR